MSNNLRNLEVTDIFELLKYTPSGGTMNGSINARNSKKKKLLLFLKMDMIINIQHMRLYAIRQEFLHT